MIKGSFEIECSPEDVANWWGCYSVDEGITDQFLTVLFSSNIFEIAVLAELLEEFSESFTRFLSSGCE